MSRTELAREVALPSRGLRHDPHAVTRLGRLLPVAVVCLLLLVPVLGSTTGSVPGRAPPPEAATAVPRALHARPASENTGDGMAERASLRATTPSLSQELPARDAPSPPTPRASLPLESTLVLSNNSVVAGNFLPENGAAPIAAVVDTVDGKIFVAGYWSNNILVLSQATHQLEGYIPGFVNPSGLAFDPGHDALFVASSWNSTFYRLTSVQASTGLTLASVLVSGGFQSLTVDPVHGHVFVTSYSPIPVYQVIEYTSPGLVLSGVYGLSGSPSLLVMGPGDQELYVIHSPSDLSLINATTGAFGPTYLLSDYPIDMVLDPMDEDLYLVGWTGSGSQEMVVLSTITFAQVDSIGLPQLAWMLTVDPSSGDVFVGTMNGSGLVPAGNGNVSVFAPTSLSRLASVPVGISPWGLAYDPQGSIVVTDERSDGVTFVNATTFGVEGVTVPGPGPSALAVDPSSGVAYITSDGTDQVNALSMSGGRISANITVGEDPRGICVDPTTGEVYVTNQGSGNVSVIDGATEKVVATVPVGPSPYGIAFDAKDDLVWVAVAGAGMVSAISALTNKVVENVTIWETPMALLYDPVDDSVDVTAPLSDNVLALRGVGHTSVSTYPVYGNAPYAIALDGVGNRLVVANYYSGNLSVLNAATGAYEPSVQLALGSEPSAVSYLPTVGEVAVANAEGNNVTVLSGSSLAPVETFQVGLHPEALGPGNGRQLYVANYGSGSITTATLPAIGWLNISVVPGGWGCRSFSLDGAPVWNGSSLALPLGNYSLSAPAFCSGGRSFQGWGSSGRIIMYGTSAVASMQLFGNGNLTAIFQLPISRVNISVDISPYFCGPVLWGMSTQLNGSSFQGYIGVTTIQAYSCSGYSFRAWNTSGAIGVFSPGQPVTTADVVASGLNGSLTTWYVSNSTPPSLLVSLQAYPINGVAPLTVGFQVQVSGGRPPYSVSWSFGDGGTGTGQTTSHIYVQPGVWMAVAEVFDSGGNVTEKTVNISVTGSPPVLGISAYAQPQTLSLGQSVQFTAVVTGAPQPYSLSWSSLPPGCGPFYTAQFVCTPTQSGVFDVQVTVTDSFGQSASTLVEVTVTPTSSSFTGPLLQGPWVAGELLTSLVLAIVAWLILLRKGRLGSIAGRERRPPGTSLGASPGEGQVGPNSGTEGTELQIRTFQ